MLERGITIYPRINSMELNMLCHGHSLKEGVLLFQTYPIDSVIDILSKNVYLKKIPNRLHINFDGERFIRYAQNNDEYSGLISKGSGSNNTEYICITISDDGFGKNKSMLDKYLIPCGYFCSNNFIDHYESEDKKYSFNTFIYEKKYDNDVTDDIFKYKKYLYHITLNSYINKIFKQGLKPKDFVWTNGYFKSNNRIYLFTNFKIASDIFRNYDIYFKDKDIKNSDGLTLLQIDVSKLSTTKFYADPRQSEAIYTLDTISPAAIEVSDVLYFE